VYFVFLFCIIPICNANVFDICALNDYLLTYLLTYLKLVLKHLSLCAVECNAAKQAQRSFFKELLKVKSYLTET